MQGRFVSRDTIGEQGGVNLFGYVQNDPINWVDPFGFTQSDPSGGGHASPGGTGVTNFSWPVPPPPGNPKCPPSRKPPDNKPPRHGGRPPRGQPPILRIPHLFPPPLFPKPPVLSGPPHIIYSPRNEWTPEAIKESEDLINETKKEEIQERIRELEAEKARIIKENARLGFPPLE